MSELGVSHFGPWGEFGRVRSRANSSILCPLKRWWTQSGRPQGSVIPGTDSVKWTGPCPEPVNKRKMIYAKTAKN
jgi:hypothetical protein